MMTDKISDPQLDRSNFTTYFTVCSYCHQPILTMVPAPVPTYVTYYEPKFSLGRPIQVFGSGSHYHDWISLPRQGNDTTSEDVLVCHPLE
jgi:hypothetical protein